MDRAQYKRLQRAKRKQEHRCIQCGAQDAFTLLGRARCAACAEKIRASNAKRDPAKHRLDTQDLRAQRKQAGVCPRCGGALERGRRVCASCVQQINARAAQKRGGPKLLHDYDGICVHCGKSPALDGEELCPTCMALWEDIQAKGAHWHTLHGAGKFEDGIHDFWILETEERAFRRRKKKKKM